MLSVLPAAAKTASSPKRITLCRKAITLYVGESRKVFVQKVSPANASAKVKWTAKNGKIAFVSQKGQVKAKKAGKTTILAVSRKNSNISAAVQVVVKKKPKKVEKVCNVKAKIFNEDYTYMHLAALSDKQSPVFSDGSMYLPGKYVIRDAEDFKTLKKELAKPPVYLSDFADSCLSKYKNTDFSRESLVVVGYYSSVDYYTSENHRFVSCTTKRDASGRLCGVIKVDYDPLAPASVGGVSGFGLVNVNTVVIRMNKKDEAMIDYFEIDAPGHSVQIVD